MRSKLISISLIMDRGLVPLGIIPPCQISLPPWIIPLWKIPHAEQPLPPHGGITSMSQTGFLILTLTSMKKFFSRQNLLIAREQYRLSHLCRPVRSKFAQSRQCSESTIDSEGFKGGTRGAPIMPRDAVSRTANFGNWLRKRYTLYPSLKASIHDATLRESGTSNRWRKLSKCRDKWMEVSDWFAPTVAVQPTLTFQSFLLVFASFRGSMRCYYN